MKTENMNNSYDILHSLTQNFLQSMTSHLLYWFYYAEYESGDQIGLSRQDFEKIEENVLKRVILALFITRLCLK